MASGTDPREHLLSYADESMINLSPGRWYALTFKMHEGEMKLIFPDTLNLRLVRIPDMHPTSYTDLTQFRTAGYGMTTDIAFDAHGKYIISNGSLLLFEDITQGVLRTVPQGGIVSVLSITMDSDSDRAYMYGNVLGSGYQIGYATNILALKNGSPGSPVWGAFLTLPAGFPNNVTAMRYKKGALYLASTDPSPAVYRFVPGATTIMRGTSANLLNPTDLLIKGKYLYATNYPTDFHPPNTPPLPATIEVFDKDTMAHIGSYGSRTTTPYDSRAGYFFGPHYFIAPTNRKIYIADDGTNDDPQKSVNNGTNRIVALDSIFDWSGWETLYAGDIPGNDCSDTGSGTPFQFFVC
jgi:hypothetical protein